MSSTLGICLLLSLLQLPLISCRVFERCELAGVLKHQYGLPAAQVATLVCIAQHSSDLNTAAFGGGTGPSGGSHGIFQISDVYWCSPPGQGAGCGLSCARLRDDDIADDVLCVRRIYAEHQRISGDGFTAWQAYSTYCRQDQAASYVAGCGQSGQIGSSPSRGQHNNHALQVAASYLQPQRTQPHYQQGTHQAVQVSSSGKIYSRCELAQELYYQHKLPMQQIPTWVCIAQHESSYNTAAVGRLNADGSADHGLFQISDLYWCTHDNYQGKGCHASCNQFLDSSIVDDVQCIRKIHQEHTQISGDGFTAWTVYNRDCRNQRYEHVAACFTKPQPPTSTTDSKSPSPNHPNRIQGDVKLSYQSALQTTPNPYYRQNNQKLIGYQSTSSYQHNPFLRVSQVQAHPNAIGYSQKSYQVTPANPLFSYKHQQQHTTTQHYQQQHYQQQHYQQQHYQQQHHNTNPQRAGKVYKRCELAQELYFKHKFPMQDLATWLCIAEHESSYNTAAVGRLNADGSEDHGLFQISDLYWCSHPEKAEDLNTKACLIDCNHLLDSDIADDVECIKTIHAEHTRLSGDGFTAWTVYNGHCRDQSLAQLSDCFEGNEIAEAEHNTRHWEDSKATQKQLQVPTKLQLSSNPSAQSINHPFGSNPFLQKLHPKKQIERIIDVSISKSSSDRKLSQESVKHLAQSVNHPFGSNPFLQHLRPQQQTEQLTKEQPINIIENVFPQKSNYNQNPFLNQLKTPSVKKIVSQSPLSHAYESNPFLSILNKPIIVPITNRPKIGTTSRPTKATIHPYVNSDSFRHEIIKFTATTSPTTIANHLSTTTTKTRPFTTVPTLTPTTTTRRTTTKHLTTKSSTTTKSTTRYTTTIPATRPTTTTPTARPTKTTRGPTTRQTTTRPTTRPTTTTTTTRSTANSPTSRYTATISTRWTTTRPTSRLTTTTQPTRRTTTRTTTRSTTAQPRTSKLPTQPTPTTRSTTSRPTTSRPTTSRPTTSRPTTSRPTTSRPTTSRPTTSRPSTTRPTTSRTTTTWSPFTFAWTTTRYPTTTTTTLPYVRSSTTYKTTTLSNTTTRPFTTTRSSTTYGTTTRPNSTTRPFTTTRPNTTTRPFTATTYKTTARPISTTRQTTTTRPFTTTRSSTTYRTTSRSLTASRPFTTTGSSTTYRTTTRPFTTSRPFTTTAARPYVRSSTTHRTTTRPFTTTHLPINKLSVPLSTTPRPYLFTSTSKPRTTTTSHQPVIRTTKSVTTADPFSHPFFAKFNARFTTTTTTTRKPTSIIPVIQSNFSTSPFYAKFQDNSFKVAAKTVFAYNFGQNQTTRL